MQLTHHTLYRGLWIAALATLGACGGGGGGSAGNPVTGASVSGVAATGMAIANGQISLKCAAGTTADVSTLPDGSYSVDISQVKLPCMVRVQFNDASGRSQKLHSVALAAGIVNITPVTDLVVANLSSTGLAADAFDKLSSTEVEGYTKERIHTASLTVKTALEAKGVDTTHLPDDSIGTKFRAATGTSKGDDHDGVLDALKDRLDEQGETLHDMEDEIRHGHETSGVASTSTGMSGDAVAGKTAYEASCQSCHGARVPDAVNAAKILRAIQKNEGGMASLSTTINATMADNIATYMASGAGTSVTVRTTQTISFASPGAQTLGSTPPALSAVSSSGLPVTLVSTTPVVCSVNNGALVLLTAGTCSLRASQNGNATYSKAVAVVNSFTVASATGVVLPSQTITFVSPGALTVGTPVTLSASADSGLAVTLSSTTSAVCSLSGNTLTLLTAGTCTVTASQSGNSSFAAASSVSRNFAVSGPAAVASALNGKALYISNSCGGCHGIVPATLNVLAGANNPTSIQNAISAVSSMNGYAGLSSQALADMAAYLATPTL
jgi:mono/diheme cytochrome c family protein